MAQSEEPERPRPVPCIECGRPPFAAVGIEGGHYVNVCFQHYREYEELRLRKIEMHRQMADYFEDQIADTMGMPRKQRPQPIPAPRVNVHQVLIQGHNYGVVNQGTVQSIANNLTIMQGESPELAAKLKELTEAVLASSLSDSQKQEAVDLLSEGTENAAKPAKERRSKAAMNLIVAGLERVLATAANLATLWSAVEPHLK